MRKNYIAALMVALLVADVTLTLSEKEVGEVLNVLQQGPWVVVNPIIGKIVGQVKSQQAPKAPAPPEAPALGH